MLRRSTPAVRGRALRRRRRPLSRAAAGGAILLALVATNTGLEAVNRAAFPSTTTTGVMHTDRVSSLLPHAYWVFFPGFGIDFCADVERAMAPVTRDTGRSFCVAPSPARLDPAEIAGAVRTRVDADRPGRAAAAPVTLYFYGISMGGMIAYDVARQLDGHDGITVRAIVFDSSPAGPESVSGAKKYAVAAGAAINRLPDLPGNIPNPLKGGPLNRFIGHVGEAMAANVSNRNLPISGSDLKFAWYKATRVTSDGVTNQMQYIEGFYPPRDPAALPYASFAYLRAQDAGADTTVDVQRATQTYATLVAPRPLAVYPISGGFHASADTTVASYAAAMRGFVSAAGLATADDVEHLRFAETVRRR